MFFICIAILYPNIKLGIASGNAKQARMVVIQKIKGELIKNKVIANEIKDIKTAVDDCVVEFNNGSEIRAITVDQGRGGDGARGWRFSYLLIDEARLVKDDIIEEILIPMTKTNREAALNHGVLERGKVVYITSAHLKISPIYTRFMTHYDQMIAGNERYLAMSLPYQVGVEAKLFDQDDIEEELLKPTMSKDRFAYE